MALDSAKIDLVQASFAKVAPIADQAAAIFYEKLFTIAPEVQPLFNAPLDEQGRKLMATLAVVVNGLRDHEKILPVAGDLAVRHVGYGVKPDHYAPVGQALLETLDVGLGADFTPDTRDAWTEAYTALSGAMIAAAYPENPSA